MDLNGNGKRDLSRIISHRQIVYHSEEGSKSSDLEFVYDDADTFDNEISELYSYTEGDELQLNFKAFEELLEPYGAGPYWEGYPREQQMSIVFNLLDQLEVSNKEQRMKAARCILYLLQGCWSEVLSDHHQEEWTVANVMLFYEAGAFPIFVKLLNIEIENNATSCASTRKLAVSLSDSIDLRVILSVLYTMTEVMREKSRNPGTIYKRYVNSFMEDLSIERLRDLKNQYREEAGLDTEQEDTIEVAQSMRASSPPISAADLLETQNQKRNNRSFRKSLMKQSSLDEPGLAMEYEGSDSGGNSGTNEVDGEMVVFMDRPGMGSYQTYYEDQNNQQEQRLDTQQLLKGKGLPWTPKVRQKDVDTFLEASRLKFVGYKLQGDRESLAGLPQPIHEGVNTLKRHMYTSLAEVQIQKEEEIARNPLSTAELPIRQTPAEILYQAMLPNLPQYMIALLKILLAAAPTSKVKTDSINIMADVLPDEMPMTVLQSMKLGIDVNRHKEIIVKAVSAILLLLLKHFKLNHVYQFEFMSQHLVFANCIPLVLKFLNQNILAYIEAKNVIPILDFPTCVIGGQIELTTDSIEFGNCQTFSWRNVFSCINLLRILNKLTKWKHSRIMMLVVFKSAPILKRTLKVRHAMMQLYVLKLLKMQTKYLGRQWRKTNMKTISVIYAKVRHRLNDDWAYGNDLEARPWDFQVEECELRSCVDQFNNRRYSEALRDEELEPVDTSITSVLGTNVELTEEFKQHYELWLQQEVFQQSINWDELLDYGRCEI